jgi:hypothetical protein
MDTLIAAAVVVFGLGFCAGNIFQIWVRCHG